MPNGPTIRSAPGSIFARGSVHAAASRHLQEQDVQQALERIPSLPTVVTEILRLARNEHSTVGQLEKHLREDMALAGRLLKLVNSSFYALPTRVSNLSQAVNLVGFSSLKSLALASAATGLLSLDVSAYGFAPAGLWKHSLATAVIGRRAARLTGLGSEEAEEIFVACLLRDVGMAVLGPLMARERLVLVPGEDLITQERRVTGYDHCTVAAIVATRWNLPKDLGWILAHHHGDLTHEDPAMVRRVALVRLAERAANRSLVALVEHHPFANEVTPALLSSAGLSAETFAALIAEVPTLITQAAEAS